MLRHVRRRVIRVYQFGNYVLDLWQYLIYGIEKKKRSTSLRERISHYPKSKIKSNEKKKHLGKNGKTF